MGRIIRVSDLQSYYTSNALLSDSASFNDYPIGNAGRIPSNPLTRTFYIVGSSFRFRLYLWFQNGDGINTAQAHIMEAKVSKYKNGSWQLFYEGGVYDYYGGGGIVDSVISGQGWPVYLNSLYFSHNTNLSNNAYDNSFDHLWKVDVKVYGTKAATVYPAQTVANISCDFYGGFSSGALSSNVNPNLTKQYNLIRRCYMGLWTKGSPYGDDDTFVMAQAPGKRGDIITSDNAKYCLSGI